MADETQVAPVAGAQENNATQEQPTKVAPFIYYYSDPDEADQLLHHLPIPSFIDLSQQIMAGKLWHIYNIPAPADGMEDPIVDVRTNTWVENSKNAQTKVLAKATQAIDDLKAKNEELDQANIKADQVLRDMQEVQAQSSKQSLALMKRFTEQTQNTNEILGTMQKTLAMVTKAVGANSNNATPATDTKPADQATDKQ